MPYGEAGGIADFRWQPQSRPCPQAGLQTGVDQVRARDETDAAAHRPVTTRLAPSRLVSTRESLRTVI